MRQQVKDMIFRSYIVGKRLGGLFGNGQRDRIAILCYHRVSDDLRDHVTVGIEQFDRQVAHLKANYRVAALRDLIETGPGDDEGPIAAITFDDGYLDNYENAFPILRKHGVSATFFISTDHITEQKPFDHDLEKLGYGLPNMSWDQIREMHDQGMDFGSHTANHVDLGKLGETEALEELARSDQAMKAELGIGKNLFAFPFGRPENMTRANHDLIRKVGYRCCCSAHGGLNTRADLDRFDVKRIGVNYGFSLPALKAYMAGWRHSHANAT